MKRGLIAFVAAVLVISFVILLSAGVLGVYAANNIDFDTDKRLFDGAREDTATEYLAYDTDGELISIWKGTNGQRKEWCPLGEMGKYLPMAVISAEDREFYSHSGVNLRRTVGAVANYFLHFTNDFGASTITQQVIKNISGDNEYSAKRKLNEMLRAINLEKHYSKDDILELYLNIVPMSHNMYGVGAAAQIYFGKEPSELSLSESATLVGITNSPARYNPYTHADACIDKRNKVLYAMLDNKAITEEEYIEATNEPLSVSAYESKERFGSWFVEYANEEILSSLVEKYGISRSAAAILLRGGRAVLTVDTRVQEALEEYFENTDNLPSELERGLNYSMVVYDNDSGALAAVIGGAGEKGSSQFYNLATAPITPGSALKPLALYGPLIEEGRINWSTVLADVPLSYTETENGMRPFPRNSPMLYQGNISINDALRLSKNTVAVRLYNIMGKERVFDSLTDSFGFNLLRGERDGNGKYITDMDVSPLALGQLTKGISLAELTAAYTVFPSDGVLRHSGSFYAVYDSEGRVLLEADKSSRQIYSQPTARIMSQMLMNVTDSGTASGVTLKNSIDVAGKTGTSGGDLDRVFIGFTPYYTAGIWCGYPDKSSAVGTVLPSHIKIWDDVMRDIHRRTVMDEYEDAERSFSTVGLKYCPYCTHSGMMPGEDCTEVEYGYFTPSSMPSEKCDAHRSVSYPFDVVYTEDDTLD